MLFPKGFFRKVRAGTIVAELLLVPVRRRGFLPLVGPGVRGIRLASCRIWRQGDAFPLFGFNMLGKPR